MIDLINLLVIACCVVCITAGFWAILRLGAGRKLDGISPVALATPRVRCDQYRESVPDWFAEDIDIFNRSFPDPRDLPHLCRHCTEAWDYPGGLESEEAYVARLRAPKGEEMPATKKTEGIYR